MIRAALGACCVAAALSFTPSARADPNEIVTVVRPAKDAGWVDEATTRLVAELRAAGFRVRVVAAREGIDGREQVESPRKATGERTVATIAIVSTTRGAEADVWVADNVTKKTLVRRVVEADATSPNAASDLAVRSVELLRASLLEVTPPQKSDLPPSVARWLDAKPGEKSPAPPRPAPSLPTPRASPTTSPPTVAVSRRGVWAGRPFVEAATGFLASPSDGVAATPAIVRVGYELDRGVGLRLTVAPSLALSREQSSATMSIRQNIGVLDATYSIGGPGARLSPRLSLGIGAYYLDTESKGLAPLYGRQQSFAAAFASAGAGLGLRLRDDLRIVADASALIFQAEPQVTIGPDVVFQTGRPAVFGSLGVVTLY